jgi:hypothetical protein
MKISKELPPPPSSLAELPRARREAYLDWLASQDDLELEADGTGGTVAVVSVANELTVSQRRRIACVSTAKETKKEKKKKQR